MATSFRPLDILFIVDPLSTFEVKKDSTIPMMEAAQKRGWNVSIATLDDLFIDFSIPMSKTKHVEIDHSQNPFAKILKEETRKLDSFNLILMRKDPPYNMEYIYAASLLNLVDPKKTLVSNRPASLRTFNEKFLVNLFPEFMAPSIFTRNQEKLVSFLDQHGKCVVKPMDAMGGQGVFIIQEKDPNRNVILETLTDSFSKMIVAQKYLPEIVDGDRRIIVIGGKALTHALVRKPSSKDHRGNLAAGATAEFGKVTEYENKIVARLSPFFIENGLHLVGLDVIGKNITEINFTSPTGFVQLSNHLNISVADLYLDFLKTQLTNS